MASGALIVIYGSICASLIRLRQTRSEAPSLRVPFGPAIACVCIAIAVILLARLTLREGFLLLLTFVVASLHWFATRGRWNAKSERVEASTL